MNQANAQKSTGPRTHQGKQRSRMNAFKHNLTGNNLILQEHEYEKYMEVSNKMLADFKPGTELERQIAQKIIDTNFRLNRLAAIENNMLNFDMVSRESGVNPCDRTTVMFAQTQAWKDDAHSFDILGRYEARLTKQFALFSKELERLQAARKASEITEVTPEMASFGKMDMRRSAASQDVRLPAAPSSQPTQTIPVTPEMASFGRTLSSETPLVL
jgi:hypothetical protein